VIRAVSRLQVDPALRPGYVVTTAPWMIVLTSGWWCLVPAGLWSDGATIPALLRPLLSPLAMLSLGVAHDWASRRGARLQPPPGSRHAPYDVSLRLATDIAVAFAARAGVGPIRRALIRAALTLAAPTYWRRRGLLWRP
jgi:hypothetical protein